jgi:cyclophilin family peptidyl-prolyl cis-trans isomerase
MVSVVVCWQPSHNMWTSNTLDVMCNTGKHVVFGKVLDGPSLLTLRKIENVAAGANSRPKLPVVISECGEL